MEPSSGPGIVYARTYYVIGPNRAALALLVFGVLVGASWAQTETVLYSVLPVQKW